MPMKLIHSPLIHIALVLAIPVPGFTAPAAQDELTFMVSLDDRPIGTHRWRIVENGGRHVVESTAEFDVRILQVPVYRYRHRATETWQNGCLQRIESQTDANGARYAVDLNKTAAGYRIATSNQTVTHAADCLMSFAYWDRRFLQQSRLLNPQTGEVVAVQVEPLGESQRRIGQRLLAVEGFHILAKSQNVNIQVFYHRADGHWVALESVLENGRTLHYAAVEPDRLALDRVRD